jgi:threonine aldolase
VHGGAWIDLRSDTVTRPTAAMRAAMAAAEVGDDVYGDDPTVNGLQQRLAQRFGYEDGLFFPSGTQSNLCALLAHCQRGDEYLVGQDAHTYKYEQGGAAVLGSIQPQPIENAADGTIALAKLAAAVKPDDLHFARTRLLALENTIGGKPLPQDYLAQATAFARARGLATHLDGARLFNALTAYGVLGDEAGEHAAVAGFDSVSICLNKGLGCPAGSVLLGSRALIAQARRWRKAAGGGLRQAGILAAAGLYALDHHLQRLADDHRHAARLADGLRGAGFTAEAHTNLVFFAVNDTQTAPLRTHLANCGIRATIAPWTRLAIHLDVGAAQIEQVLEAFSRFASSLQERCA